MQKSDFYFELPAELIAQTPLTSREQSRLLCMDRVTGTLAHHHFYELPKLLKEGDCLVLNDSRVLPARLIGSVDKGTGSLSSACPVEVVLLRDVSPANDKMVWECLTKPGKKTKPGTEIVFGDRELTATVIGITDGGNRLLEFSYKGIFMEVLERLGKMPLPPYIHEELEDAERYQTVYSSEVGSAAAPTAGLHFTKELLDEIASKGVDIRYVTLHVGLGTFRPVKTDNIEDHDMHAEYFIISEETASAVNKTKSNGGRVIAVGTTSCRVLESCSDDNGLVSAFSGFTDIFIYPGYKYKCLDGLITNFHLPESTLIMLVSAFAGRKNTLNAYDAAIKEKYRFFSFGDCMIIV
ncbi:MAG: tRNA preQ1(34) S-adenosylmethionine ribosyltransferase-isomerase QueA [Oscillospiraceae bacterium]|nr:tRNA preQ1(34) S-adenosylmethionine ribosyltransferase-isomerase QueA [Oscillospiraceae bacterium]